MILILVGFFLTKYKPELIPLASFPMIAVTILCLVMMGDIFLAFTFFTLGIIDIHLRINKVNEKALLLLRGTNPNRTGLRSRFERFTIEHNSLCFKVKKFSAISKNIYLAALLFQCPTTLIMLHLVLFESIDYFMRITYIIALIDSYAILFVLQYFIASLPHKMHRQCKLLARIQWLFNETNSSVGFKFKIQTYFERLSSDKRIGFSIGSLVVITFPLFAGVSFH